MKPTTTDNLQNVPAELAEGAQWIPTQNKQPIAKFKTGAEKQANLKPLAHWIESYRKRGKSWNGFARVIDKSEGFVFIDLDACRDKSTEELAEWAQKIVDELNSYTEISASGGGLHIVCRGTLANDWEPGHGHDGTLDYRPNKVEIKSGNVKNRIAALTGDLLPGFTPATIENRQAELNALLAKLQAETGQTDSAPQFSEELVFTSMDSIEEKSIDWLWKNRIPLSAVTIFTGNPDTGKTTALCDIAARVSSFRSFPDVKDHTFGGYVVWLSAEDDAAKVLKPRLMAAGASLEKIRVLERVEIRQGARRDERMFALDEDLKKLDAAIKAKGDSLVIIDPISSYFGKGNMYKAQDVRNVTNRLAALCENRRVAVIAVEHFNKRTDVAAIHKTGTSGALIAAARAAFMFAKVPNEDGQYVMHFVKGNFAKRKVGLRFAIDDKKVGKLAEPQPFIQWGGEDTGTADDLLAAEKGLSENGRAKRAAKFLLEYLTEEKPADDLLAEAKKRNISRDALYEVKRELGIDAVKRAGAWYWKPGANSAAF